MTSSVCAAFPPDLMDFLKDHHTAVVATLDEGGCVHTSVKGIVGVAAAGRLYVVDLYKRQTYQNILKRACVTVTVLDQDRFVGWSLQGRGKTVEKEAIAAELHAEWEERIVNRISERLLSNLRSAFGGKANYESQLPHMPQYVIEVDVEKVVDLRPTCIKEKM
jgi:uncharacterized pyridoxamine 5'-phosphate oxidase family protein